MAYSPEDQLLDIDDVSTLLGIPVRTLYAWRHRRQGPPAIKVGRHLRWRHRDVVAWLDAHRDEWAS